MELLLVLPSIQTIVAKQLHAPRQIYTLCNNFETDWKGKVQNSQKSLKKDF